MTVADYIAGLLVQNDVRHVFGFQGGAILKLLDAMVATGKIKYVQNYHEQASALSADGYARITGNLGVALATSGPGATNLITGIANAHLDSIPTLFITGQDYVANVTRGNGSRLNGFQDLDIINVVKPISKYAAAIHDEIDIRYEMEKAIYLAKSGRPGAVVIDIPIDIQFKQIDPEKLRGFGAQEPSRDLSKIPQLISMLKSSKRPVILAGGGIQISRADEALTEFVRITNVPVVNTLNGLDAFEGSYSFAGLHGNTFSNLAVQNADLLLVFGARLGQRQVGKNSQNYTSAKVVHVDIDDVELNRSMEEELSIRSDLSSFFTELNLQAKDHKFPEFQPWHAKIQEWESLYASMAHMNKEYLDPVIVTKKLSAFFKTNAIITNDVGQNQMWVSQAFRKKGSQRLLNSSGLGAMGYSLPAAIGAYYARPQSQILCFTGDGGLQMNLQELMLVGHKKLPIKIVVMNNNTLGMMREVQKRYYNEHYYGTSREEFACVDLEKLSHAYGIDYARLESTAEIPSLENLFMNEKPCIIDVRIPFDSKLSNRYDEADIFEKEKLNE